MTDDMMSGNATLQTTGDSCDIWRFFRVQSSDIEGIIDGYTSLHAKCERDRMTLAKKYGLIEWYMFKNVLRANKARLKSLDSDLASLDLMCIYDGDMPEGFTAADAETSHIDCLSGGYKLCKIDLRTTPGKKAFAEFYEVYRRDPESMTIERYVAKKLNLQYELATITEQVVTDNGDDKDKISFYNTIAYLDKKNIWYFAVPSEPACANGMPESAVIPEVAVEISRDEYAEAFD